MGHGGTKKTRHRSEESADIISNLPDVIKDKILCCLPINEAVGTCLLSSKWRYTWASMTELVFREDDFSLGNGNEAGVTGRFIYFIDMFLSLHNGPILKFELNGRQFHLPSSGGHIHRWMLMLSRNAVKEIQIRTKTWRNHKIPSCFFSCGELEHAYLQGCIFQLPPLFKGFNWLHTLQLEDFCASENDIGKMVAKCPNLENLTLSAFITFAGISIHSTKLKRLAVDGVFKNLSLHVPNVASTLIKLRNDPGFFPSTGCNINFSKFIGSLSDIETISLLGLVFKKYAEHGSFPSRPPKLFNRLTEINLDMDLGNRKEAQAAHYLFQNAPNLQRIELQLINRTGVAPTSHFWDLVDRQVGPFGNMDVVSLINFAGSSA